MQFTACQTISVMVRQNPDEISLAEVCQQNLQIVNNKGDVWFEQPDTIPSCL